MPYEIVWSPTARKNYFSILGYLHDNWTRKEFVKQVSLYYRLKGQTIELLTFWDNRQDPSSLKL